MIKAMMNSGFIFAINGWKLVQRRNLK
ncbi:hypothetical protein A2U01_0019893, partial [Trifolium medium]|nr:hypothetical protein [Trifolium medium]